MITNIIEQLRRDEGEVLHAYQDKYGFWTIGVGRLIDARKGGSITQEESALLLANDIRHVTYSLRDQWSYFVHLDPVRQAVLVNMAFNIGVNGLLKFRKMLACVESGYYEAAAKEMLDSKWAKIDVPERAKRLAEQMKSGEWQ